MVGPANSAGVRLGLLSLALLPALFCQAPPGDRSYSGLVADGAGFLWQVTPGPLPPWALPAGFGALMLGLAAWFVREHRLSTRPRKLRRLYKLGERLGSGGDPIVSLILLRQSLPELLGITDINIYLHDRASGTLRSIEDNPGSPPRVTPILPEARAGFRERTAALCFRNRALIVIPDTRRSPLYEPAADTPRAAMFVPMLAPEEVAGVLEIGNSRRARSFSSDEQAVVQHLANQIAIGMRLLEQKSLREGAAGNERFDVMCQFVALTAEQLSEPLGRIRVALRALAEPPDISSELEKVEGTLSRLLRLTGARPEEYTVDLVSLVRKVVKSRQAAWQKLGIRSSESLPAEKVVVVAVAPSYLEEMLTSLFRNVEQMWRGRSDQPLRVRLSCLTGAAQLDISFEGARPDSGVDPLDDWQSRADDALSLAACRSLIRSLRGDLRLAADAEGGLRFEAELPLAQPGSESAPVSEPAPERPASPLTVLVLQPEAPSRRSLVSLLGAIGHRSVAAANVDEALDLVKRIWFHGLFCSANLPGQGWPQCFEGSRGRVGAFVLLTRGHDPTLAGVLSEGGAFTLSEPVRPDELKRLLEEVDARVRGLGQYNGD
jgi:GAF domain-containing protein